MIKILPNGQAAVVVQATPEARDEYLAKAAMKDEYERRRAARDKAQADARSHPNLNNLGETLEAMTDEQLKLSESHFKHLLADATDRLVLSAYQFSLDLVLSEMARRSHSG